MFFRNILYASETITFNKEEKKLQRFDNRAYRYILQVPIFTASEFLRSEVGSSCVQSRDIKNKILFSKHALKDESNSILNSIMSIEIEIKNTDWSEEVNNYMELINLYITQIFASENDQREC